MGEEGKHTDAGRRRERQERKREVKEVGTKACPAPYLFNSPDSNFSPVVDISIIVVSVIKHSGYVGDFPAFSFSVS